MDNLPVGSQSFHGEVGFIPLHIGRIDLHLHEIGQVQLAVRRSEYHRRPADRFCKRFCKIVVSDDLAHIPVAFGGFSGITVMFAPKRHL